MQASFSMNPAKAVEGQPVGDRSTRNATLPWRAQQTQIRIADASPAASETWTVQVTDDESGQVHSMTFLSGASLAATLDNWVAAHALSPMFNALFSVTEDGVDDFLPVARHANRTYTWAVTPGGSATAVITTLVTAGGDGVELGRVVVRGASEYEYDEISAAKTIDDIIGVLFRTEGNHFHSLENDLPTAVDRSQRGKMYAIMTGGRFYAKVEEAVVPGGPVFVRRALTSSAGRLGGFRTSPAGSAQASTVVPIVNLPSYGFSLGYKGKIYPVVYVPTDGTTAVADAIDGLYDALNAVLVANGIDADFTIAESDTELTITTDAGIAIDSLVSHLWSLDTEAVSCTVTVGAADVDTIDVSSKFEYLESAAADGFALVRVNLAGV